MIPNGPAKIEWIGKDEHGRESFRWLAFPTRCRRKLYGKEVAVGKWEGWEVRSELHPQVTGEVGAPILYVPGTRYDTDDRLEGWTASRDVLERIVEHINAEYWCVSDKIAALLGL